MLAQVALCEHELLGMSEDVIVKLITIVFFHGIATLGSGGVRITECWQLFQSCRRWEIVKYLFLGNKQQLIFYVKGGLGLHSYKEV